MVENSTTTDTQIRARRRRTQSIRNAARALNKERFGRLQSDQNSAASSRNQAARSPRRVAAHRRTYVAEKPKSPTKLKERTQTKIPWERTALAWQERQRTNKDVLAQTLEIRDLIQNAVFEAIQDLGEQPSTPKKDYLDQIREQLSEYKFPIKLKGGRGKSAETIQYTLHPQDVDNAMRELTDRYGDLVGRRAPIEEIAAVLTKPEIEYKTDIHGKIELDKDGKKIFHQKKSFVNNAFSRHPEKYDKNKDIVRGGKWESPQFAPDLENNLRRHMYVWNHLWPSVVRTEARYYNPAEDRTQYIEHKLNSPTPKVGNPDYRRNIQTQGLRDYITYGIGNFGDILHTQEKSDDNGFISEHPDPYEEGKLIAGNNYPNQLIEDIIELFSPTNPLDNKYRGMGFVMPQVDLSFNNAFRPPVPWTDNDKMMEFYLPDADLDAKSPEAAIRNALKQGVEIAPNGDIRYPAGMSDYEKKHIQQVFAQGVRKTPLLNSFKEGTEEYNSAMDIWKGQSPESLQQLVSTFGTPQYEDALKRAKQNRRDYIGKDTERNTNVRKVRLEDEIWLKLHPQYADYVRSLYNMWVGEGAKWGFSEETSRAQAQYKVHQMINHKMYMLPRSLSENKDIPMVENLPYHHGIDPYNLPDLLKTQAGKYKVLQIVEELLDDASTLDDKGHMKDPDLVKEIYTRLPKTPLAPKYNRVKPNLPKDRGQLVDMLGDLNRRVGAKQKHLESYSDLVQYTNLLSDLYDTYQALGDTRSSANVMTLRQAILDHNPQLQSELDGGDARARLYSKIMGKNIWAGKNRLPVVSTGVNDDFITDLSSEGYSGPYKAFADKLKALEGGFGDTFENRDLSWANQKNWLSRAKNKKGGIEIRNPLIPEYAVAENQMRNAMKRHRLYQQIADMEYDKGNLNNYYAARKAAFNMSGLANDIYAPVAATFPKEQLKTETNDQYKARVAAQNQLQDIVPSYLRPVAATPALTWPTFEPDPTVMNLVVSPPMQGPPQQHTITGTYPAPQISGLDHADTDADKVRFASSSPPVGPQPTGVMRPSEPQGVESVYKSFKDLLNSRISKRGIGNGVLLK